VKTPISTAVSESILGAPTALHNGGRGAGIKRLTRSMEVLHPAIVADASLVYFREFVAREALRHDQATGSTD
jgi:hypothetical protein